MIWHQRGEVFAESERQPRRWRMLASVWALPALLAACIHQPQPATVATAAMPTASGAAIYERACATCHDGGAIQAPRRESLAALSSERILAAMTTGIMSAQASSLSSEEKETLAAYLSAPKTQAGAPASRCMSTPTKASAPGKVFDWGMRLENWRAVGKDQTSVSAENASDLKLAWVFAFPGSTRSRVQPTVAGDVLFTADQFGTVYALDAATGCTRWTVQSDKEIRSPLIVGTNTAGEPDTLYFGDIAGQVHAIDLATRRIAWTVRPDTHPQATITGAIRLYKGRLYVPISSLEVVAAMDGAYACCTFRGAVAALDAKTGATVWKTYTIAEEPRVQGTNRVGVNQVGPSGAPVWSTPTIDEKRGRLYIGTGENYSHPATTTSDAIMALDLASGQIVWRFQATENDIWNAACPSGPNCPVNTGPDYDFGAAPILVELADGRAIVLAGQKSGDVYGLDPDKGGAVVWKTKPGRGGIMGGVHWGMATDGKTLFVPISDLSVYPKDAHLPAQSGMHALDIATGKALWSTVLPNVCNGAKWRCSPGVSAAATFAPGVVFGGSLDGTLRAFSARGGEVLWTFDTNRQFEAVNGITGSGGSIDSSGPVVAGKFVYATSGYDKFGQKGGNLLLAFNVGN
jgi:polyvinyl alcohol dehydrogenase (cytochrome)